MDDTTEVYELRAEVARLREELAEEIRQTREKRNLARAAARDRGVR